MLLDIPGGQQEFFPDILHGSPVHGSIGKTRLGRQLDIVEDVFRFFDIEIARKDDPRIQEGRIDTYIGLTAGLPGQALGSNGGRLL